MKRIHLDMAETTYIAIISYRELHQLRSTPIKHVIEQVIHGLTMSRRDYHKVEKCSLQHRYPILKYSYLSLISYQEYFNLDVKLIESQLLTLHGLRDF